jgi:hypothetical protein
MRPSTWRVLKAPRAEFHKREASMCHRETAINEIKTTINPPDPLAGMDKAC